MLKDEGANMVLRTIILAVFLHAVPVAAFDVGIELSSQVPITPAEEAAIRELGIDYVNYYVNSTPGAADLPAMEVNNAMMEFCSREPGLKFSISCHQIDPPTEVVAQAVAFASDSGNNTSFEGVVFDELEHARLLTHFSPTALADYNNFTSFEQAYEETLAGYRALHEKYAAVGSPVVATHMWPVLNHVAAKAGFTVCPKICKELYSPVSLAIAMGAAKQYNTPLWADCDLWFWDLIPGHPPEEFESNLLLAYWMGVDRVYVEGAGFNLKPAGKQGVPFSLMNIATPGTYQLTPHGEILRRFCREYVPSHPRDYTFRDVEPSMALIRFEDTCHGQRYTADWDDHLYGSPHLRSDADTEAWLHLWNLLTFGKTGSDGLSLFKSWVRSTGYERAVMPELAPSYLSRPAQAGTHRFFVPLNGMIVYDHTAGYELLKGIPLLFLAGKSVSPETMAAIRRCVEEGAVCVAWGALAKRNGFDEWTSGVSIHPSGKGKFVITDHFGYGEVYRAIQPWMGRPDEIAYRFGGKRVVLKRVSDNEVTMMNDE